MQGGGGVSGTMDSVKHQNKIKSIILHDKNNSIINTVALFSNIIFFVNIENITR